MIFGNYPCCGADLAFAMPDQTPKYLPEACPSCGAKVWHVLSRLDPQSFTEDEFLQRYEVDHENRTIRERNPASEPPEWLKQFIAAKIENWIMYGDSRGEKPVGLINQVL